MTDHFSDLSPEFLRARRNSKWSRYQGDVIPAWIAETDFAIAPAIQTAVERLTAQQDYGYPRRTSAPAEGDVSAAFVRRMGRLYGWEIDPGSIQPVTDLIQATLAAIVAFSDRGDGVIVQTPCYPPFRKYIAEAGRVMVDDPLVDDGAGYRIDFEALARRIDARTRLWVLCNPQNPTGRVFTEPELRQIADFARAHDLIIISDEIHSDLIHDDARHIPIASLGPDVAERTITINSPTKSFNLPGLRCGVMHFGTDILRERFHGRLPRVLMGKPSVYGIDATIAAWEDSDAWLSGLMTHLGEMRDLLATTLAERMPGLRMHLPEGTYLAWVDCCVLSEPAAEFFLKKAGVALSPGEEYAPAMPQFVRLNFATSRLILEEILDRMSYALSHVAAGAAQ